MTTPPQAPWALRGEAMVALSWRRPVVEYPEGIDPAPGPTAIAAVRYTDSPVGSFLQLAVLVPARLGAHPGWFTTMVVADKPDAIVGFRENWGIPALYGELRWFASDGERQLLWEDRDFAVKARGRGFGVPMVLPHRLVQTRVDGPVVISDRHWGLVRPAMVTVEVGRVNELSCLRGRRIGATVDGCTAGWPQRVPQWVCLRRLGRLRRRLRRLFFGATLPVRPWCGVSPILHRST